jgi:hypothetical protein
MEEQASVWDPSVNVVLDGGMFTSPQDFENFMQSITPTEGAASVLPPASKALNPCGVLGAKRAPAPMSVRRPKRCRKSRKEEIEHVRAVATELERKLRELNQAHVQENPGSDPFWKRISNRLLEERQKSALENARLRGLVRERVATIKALQRTVEKTPALSVSGVNDSFFLVPF